MKKGIGVFALIISVLSSFAQVSYWEQSVLNNYESGLRLYDKQLFAAATDKFSEVLNVMDDPTHEVYVGSEFYRAMCSVYLLNKDAEEMVLLFIKNHPTSPRVNDAVWSTSEFMFNTRKYKKSAEWLKKLDPNGLSDEEKMTYHFRLGYSFFMRKEYKNASDQFYRIKDNTGKYAASAKYYYAHIAYTDTSLLKKFQ